jgi:hypothetical protein
MNTSGLWQVVSPSCSCIDGCEHEHGPLGDPELHPYGNGVLLSFELDDFEAPSRGEYEGDDVKGSPSRKNGNWEFGCGP